MTAPSPPSVGGVAQRSLKSIHAWGYADVGESGLVVTQLLWLRRFESFYPHEYTPGRVVELVYAARLERAVERHAGSTPVSATMIVDYNDIRKWTKKVSEAVNKAAALHPDSVLTLVDTRTNHFIGIRSTKFMKRHAKTWRLYNQWPQFGLPDAYRLTVSNEDSRSIELPVNWSFGYLHDHEWDGTISQGALLVKDFW